MIELKTLLLLPVVLVLGHQQSCQATKVVAAGKTSIVNDSSAADSSNSTRGLDWTGLLRQQAAARAVAAALPSSWQSSIISSIRQW